MDTTNDEASTNNKSSKKQVKHTNTGGIRVLFTSAFNLISLLVSCYLIALCIEFVGVIFGLWEQQGVEHSKYVTSRYLLDIERDLNNNSLLINPAFILEYLLSLSNSAGLNLPELITSDYQDGIVGFIHASLLIMANVFFSFIIKISYFVTSLPLGIFVLLPLIVDGYCYRMIRKYKGGRDSDLKLNISAKFANMSFTGLILLFISIPIYIYPMYVAIPIFVLSGIGLRLVASNFIKYV